MVGRQELDRAAEHLAAEIVDRHLRGLDLAAVEIAVDAGEAFHDADLERRRRLGLRQGHQAQGSQAGDGRGPADMANRFTNSHVPILPKPFHSPQRTEISSGRARAAPVLDSGAKLRLIRHTARGADGRRRSNSQGGRADEGVQGLRRGQERRSQRPAPHHPRPDRAEWRGQDDVLQPAHALPDADGGPDPLQGPQHHRQLACGDRAHGAGALVPDLGGLPASFGARECACRSAAQARQLLPFLAQRARAEPARQPRPGAGDGRGPRSLRRAAGRRPALWPQAGAGDRHHAGARSRDDAARRADGRAWGRRTSSASRRSSAPSPATAPC